MERKNENEFLKLKNYSSFLLDLGLNVSFSQDNYMEVEQGKIHEKFVSIQDVDDYIKEWQIKNNFQLILRNKNISDINNSNLFIKNLFGELGIFLIEK